MIRNAVETVRDQVNDHLQAGQELTDAVVVLGNVAQLETGNNQDTLANKVILSLVNLEEESLLKNEPRYRVVEKTNTHRFPQTLYLNLFLLFSANTNDYAQGLGFLSQIASCLQQRSVITPALAPGLDPRIDKLLLEIYSLNLEYLNHLWGVLGGKYMPSILYKMRLVTIQPDAVDVVPNIQKIRVGNTV